MAKLFSDQGFVIPMSTDVWNNIATEGGTVAEVLGTTNEITVTTVDGVATVAYSSAAGGCLFPHAVATRTLEALNNNSIGTNNLAAITTGSANIGIGVDVAHSQATGDFNIYVGNIIAPSANTCDYNVCVGTTSAPVLTTGNANTIVGYGAGVNVTTGIGNICIGRDSGPATNETGYIVLGSAGDNVALDIPNIMNYGDTAEGFLSIQGGIIVSDSLVIQTGGLNYSTGNIKSGSVTLSSGSATVACASIAYSDTVILNRHSIGDSTALGLTTFVITPGTGFAVNSVEVATPGTTQTGDNSTFDFIVMGVASPIPEAPAPRLDLLGSVTEPVLTQAKSLSAAKRVRTLKK